MNFVIDINQNSEDLRYEARYYLASLLKLKKFNRALRESKGLLKLKVIQEVDYRFVKEIIHLATASNIQHLVQT